MDPENIENALVESVLELVREHRDILLGDIHERTLGPHLAACLKPRFLGFHVDCEYNLDVDDTSDRKRVYGEGVKDGSKVYPDVIVHHRRMNGPENNLLVIEVKKCGQRQPSCAHDRAKLCYYTSFGGSNHLGFLRGALLIIGVGQRVGEYKIEWFSEGKALVGANLDG